jgi:hypothetical protein
MHGADHPRVDAVPVELQVELGIGVESDLATATALYYPTWLTRAIAAARFGTPSLA